LTPVIPALVNAIYDAVGVRIDEAPVSPEKIVKALADLAKGGEGRVGPGDFPEIDWPEPYIVPPPWEGGDGDAINEPQRKRAAKMHKMDQVVSS
jgi:4-hydroxybenzoyl-CoA reductase subunit alpha